MAYPGNDPTEDRRSQERDGGDDREAIERTRERLLGERRPPEGRPPEGRHDARAPGREGRGPEVDDRDTLYFFPDEVVTETRVRWILQQGSSEERAWVVSHLLRYAQWTDIWKYVTRDEVREIFPQLDLPERLRHAWARMLKVEQPVG